MSIINTYGMNTPGGKGYSSTVAPNLVGGDVPFAVDSSGNVTGLVGPGGYGVRVFSNERTIVLLGDSFENFCYPSNGSPWNDYASSYFACGNMELNWAYKALNSAAGVGGQTSVQIAARVYTDAIAYMPDRVLVGGGSNDDLSTTAKVDTAWNAISGAYTAILSAGIALTIRTHPGKNTDTTAQIIGNADLNNRKRRFADQYKCQLLDLAAVVCNPETGLMLAAGAYGALANMYQVDNTHLSITASSYVGSLFANVHAPFVSKETKTRRAVGGVGNLDVIYDATNGVMQHGSLIQNGKMLGTAGTNSSAATFPGSVASTWTLNAGGTVPATGGSGAVSKVARNGPWARGEWQQVTINPGASGQTGSMSFLSSSVANNAGATLDGSRGVNIGDTIYAQMEFETDAANWCGSDGLAPTNFELRIQCANSAFTVLQGARCLPGNSPNGLNARIASGTMRTPDIVVPATTAYIFVYVFFQGVGTFRFSEVFPRKAIA